MPKIRYRNKNGEVVTCFNNDEWNGGPCWTSCLSIVIPGLPGIPLQLIAEVKNVKTYEEAGVAHLELCAKLVSGLAHMGNHFGQ